MSQEFLTPQEQLTRATLLQKIEDAQTETLRNQAQFDLDAYDHGVWERNHAHEIADKKIISKG